MEAKETTAATGAKVESPFFHGVRALADYLGDSESAMRRRLRRREFPYIKIGKMILVRKADVEARLNALTVPAREARRRAIG